MGLAWIDRKMGQSYLLIILTLLYPHILIAVLVVVNDLGLILCSPAVAAAAVAPMTSMLVALAFLVFVVSPLAAACPVSISISVMMSHPCVSSS